LEGARDCSVGVVHAAGWGPGQACGGGKRVQSKEGGGRRHAHGGRGIFVPKA